MSCVCVCVLPWNILARSGQPQIESTTEQSLIIELCVCTHTCTCLGQVIFLTTMMMTKDNTKGMHVRAAISTEGVTIDHMAVVSWSGRQINLLNNNSNTNLIKVFVFWINYAMFTQFRLLSWWLSSSHCLNIFSRFTPTKTIEFAARVSCGHRNWIYRKNAHDTRFMEINTQNWMSSLIRLEQ